MPDTLHVLLVEDDLDDIEFLKGALAENKVDFKLDSVIQGDKVLPWLENSKIVPDIIILDLNLPKMHGKEVLCKIRENKQFDMVPILVLTTSSHDIDKNYCMAHGANRFHTKPTTSEGFKVLVNAILGVAGKTKK